MTKDANGDYISMAALARYSGLSVRTLRSYLRDPEGPIPHYRVGRRVLVRRAEFDEWLRRFRKNVASADLDQLVGEITGGRGRR
jgi:excisionase family DNA binding protein